MVSKRLWYAICMGNDIESGLERLKSAAYALPVVSPDDTVLNEGHTNFFTGILAETNPDIIKEVDGAIEDFYTELSQNPDIKRIEGHHILTPEQLRGALHRASQIGLTSIGRGIGEALPLCRELDRQFNI
jgi:hypothetical protein